MDGRLRQLFSDTFKYAFTREDSISKVARTIIGAAMDANISPRDLQKALDWWNDDEQAMKNVR